MTTTGAVVAEQVYGVGHSNTSHNDPMEVR